MSGAHTIAMDTLARYALASDPTAKTGVTIAVGASSTTTVVLAVAGLLVTIGLAALGWYIVGKRRTQDRTADVTNGDLNALITQLRDVDVEARRLQDLPRPAGGDDFKELARLLPHMESHGAQCIAPVQILVADVVQDMKNLIALPVDNATPFGEYVVRVQQQTRAVDKLLDSIDKALTSARQMRS
ncbi:hypothetical protein ACFYZI_41540 [Streptomyces griseorubiginosus]|uniref:hypothetical protein n=1 Tax=Streptomyces griseorubiginosus TaxID=67304 RepID=UPI0036977A4F